MQFVSGFISFNNLIFKLYCFLTTSINIRLLNFVLIFHRLMGPSLPGHQVLSFPKNHGNSVTNWISSLLWISIVIPKFKTNNIIMSARVYFMKRVKDCKDVYMMAPQDEQWRRTSLLCFYTAIFLFY